MGRGGWWRLGGWIWGGNRDEGNCGKIGVESIENVPGYFVA